MDVYLQNKQNVLQLISEFITFVNIHISENMGAIDGLRNAAEHIKQEKLLVVVCGEFKQGKSSLINALLNEPDLLPEGQDITTNLISMVSFGPQEKFLVTFGEPGREEQKEIQRHEIFEYASEQRNQRNIKNARLLSIEIPNQRLREGLVLVDTPDVGGLYRQHTDLTYTFLPSAEAVLFVSDAHSPLHAKEIDFVQLIARHCQHVIYVVTKTDIVDGYEAIIESNRKKLSYVLQLPENDIHIIPVSSKMKLHYLQSNDIEDLDLSNFRELEQSLWELLGMRESILLGRSLNLFRLALTQVTAPLEAEMQALQHHSVAEIQEIERKWDAARQRLQEIGNHKSEWHIRIQRGIVELHVQARDALKNGFMQVRKRLGAYLDTPEQLKSPLTISTAIEQDVYELIITQESEIQQFLGDLLAETENEARLSLNIGFTELLDHPQVTTFLPELPRLTKTELLDSILLSIREAVDRARTTGQKAADTGEQVGQVVEFATLFMGQSTLLGEAGRGFGKAVGGLIGVVGGFAFGFTQEMKQISADDRQKTREDVKEIIGGFIARSEELCLTRLKEALDTLESQILEAFTGQIRLEEEICERTFVTLQGVCNLSEQELLVRKARLQHLFQEIDRLKKIFEELARAVLK